MNGLVLVTERLQLGLPDPSAADRVVRYYADNRDHHGPWDPPRPAAFETVAFWRERLERSLAERAEGTSLRLFLTPRDQADDGPVLGSVNFTGISRGPWYACHLGYSLDRNAVGKGLMSEALQAAIRYVFDELRLHRIEANYVPTNERSGRLLRRLGFAVEGYARDYLFVGGSWRDHVLTSLTSPDATPPNQRMA